MAGDLLAVDDKRHSPIRNNRWAPRENDKSPLG
jgi:hypothetical protein